MFEHFEPVSFSFPRRVVKYLKPTTKQLLDVCHVVGPSRLLLMNFLLRTGSVNPAFKHAVVQLILKKNK